MNLYLGVLKMQRQKTLEEYQKKLGDVLERYAKYLDGFLTKLSDTVLDAVDESLEENGFDPTEFITKIKPCMIPPRNRDFQFNIDMEVFAKRVKSGKVRLKDIEDFAKNLKKETEEIRIIFQTLGELYPLAEPKGFKEAKKKRIFPAQTGRITEAGGWIEALGGTLFSIVETCKNWCASDEKCTFACIAEELEARLESPLYAPTREELAKFDFNGLKEELKTLYNTLIREGKKKGLDEIIRQLPKR